MIEFHALAISERDIDSGHVEAKCACQRWGDTFDDEDDAILEWENHAGRVYVENRGLDGSRAGGTE